MLRRGGATFRLDRGKRRDTRPARRGVSVVGDDVLEAGQSAPDLEDLVDLGLRRAEDGDGFRIAEDILGLFGGEGGVHRHIGRPGTQAGVVCEGPFRPILRDNGHLVTGLDPQLPQAQRDRLHALERLAVGNADPGAAHFRPECRGQPGVPIDRGKKQLGERASVHGLNSTTNVNGLPFTAVWFTWFIVTVMTTESGTAPVGRRTRTAARPVALVKTVS